MQMHRIAIAGVMAVALACERMRRRKRPGPATAPWLPPGHGVELSILYRSEKKTWLDKQVAAFHKSRGALADRGAIRVTATPLGEAIVLSPIVIAMWKPMAEALGWPDKPIGWSRVVKPR